VDVQPPVVVPSRPAQEPSAAAPVHSLTVEYALPAGRPFTCRPSPGRDFATLIPGPPVDA
jgi:hypothetical protein